MNGIYLVFIETNSGCDIFSDIAVREKYAEISLKYEDRYLYKTLSRRFSSTAMISIIKITDIPTSKIMQGVLTSFSKYLNRHTGINGKKFKDRYRAILVKKEYIDDILDLSVEEYIKYGIPIKYIQIKGINIDFLVRKMRVSSVEMRYQKVLKELHIGEGSKEARHAHMILLNRFTTLTNRQIAAGENISESAVSKIITKGTGSGTVNDIVGKYEQIL